MPLHEISPLSLYTGKPKQKQNGECITDIK